MSTKKTSSTTARRGSATDKTRIIRQRAAAIIANLDDYNADTRDAIYNALEGVPETLAELAKHANPYSVAAARVAEILADETTPRFLDDVLTDMLCDLSNETGVNDTDPEIARILMTKAFPVAEEMGLRLMNGTISREGKAK